MKQWSNIESKMSRRVSAEIDLATTLRRWLLRLGWHRLNFQLRGNADSPSDGSRPSSAQHSLCRGDCACMDRPPQFQQKNSTLSLAPQRRRLLSTLASATLSMPMID